ncbi:MAG: EpsG family protein [Fusobacteriaceae bacterium]
MSYTLFFIYSLLVLYVLFFSGYRDEKKLIIIPAFFLSLFVGMRGAVSGYDYLVYKYFYELDYNENPYGYEILFVACRNIVKFLGGNYNAFIFLLGVFFVCGVCYIFNRYSDNPSLVLFIYLSTFFFWHNFNILRNFIAIILFYMALKFILEKKPIYYYLLIIIAINFHKTALILLPFYFLGVVKLEKIKMLLLALLAFGFIPVSNLIFNLKINFMGISERISRYSGIREMGNIQEYLEIIAVFIFATVIFFWEKKQGREMSEEENLFYNLTFYSFLIFTAFFKFAVILRVIEYFRFAYIILFVSVLGKIQKKNIKYITVMLLMVYMSMRYYKSIYDYGMANYITWF